MTSEPPPVRVLAVADADSYLKWSAATLDRLPADWHRGQVLLVSPTAPSSAQTAAATDYPITRLTLPALARLLRRDPPDVLLLACTGPTVGVLTALSGVRSARRPVLVAGLPGISIPASARAVAHRRGCDLLVVHSRRERREFVPLAAAAAPDLAVALSTLPFLVRDHGQHAERRRAAGPLPDPAGPLPDPAGPLPDPAGPLRDPAGPLRDVVFAAQALVPPRRADREAILLALADVRPVGSAVVKVRALAGEQQTHREDLPYADLWDALSAAGRVRPTDVRFVAGSMRAALARARSLVTVSSTAALEAMDAGVPVVVLTDFGVTDALINTVFQGSGCLGDLADVRAGRAFVPDPGWLADNYFHPADEDDLGARLSDLVRRRDAGLLPRRTSARPSWRGWRSAARLMLPARVSGPVRRLRELTGRRPGRLSR